MAIVPIHFGIQEYKSGVRPSSYQGAVNCYPESQEEGAKASFVVRQAYGSELFSSIGDDPIQVGGMHEMDGILYVVSGTGTYRVDEDGSSTLLGSSTQSKPVSMADNGIQLCVVNGVVPGYVYTVAAGFLPLTDPDHKASSSVGFHNNYGVFTEDDTGRFYITELNDFTTVAALDNATANSLPDNLVSHLSDKDKLLLFGLYSMEQWFESGNATFPFEKTALPTIRKGLVAINAKAILGQSFAWLGRDKVVYRFDGADGVRISTDGIEERLNEYPDVDDMFFWVYSIKGHEFLVITKPGFDSYAYDVQTTKWHKKEFYNNGNPTRFRANAYCYCYGKHLIGDYATGQILELRDDLNDDYGQHRVWQAVSNTISFGRPFAINELNLDFEQGQGLPTGQGDDPVVWVEYSYDGGKKWDSAGHFPIGQIGEYKHETKVTRLGQVQSQAIFRLTVSDPVKIALLGASIDV